MLSNSDRPSEGGAGLAGLQQWFARQILPTRAPLSSAGTDEEGQARDERSPSSMLLPSATLAADERLAIYREMVFLRLHDSLAEDYPAIRAVLGDDDFRELVLDYLDHYPSRSFTLDHAGKDLPRFVSEASHLPHRALVHDLARLEWAVHRSFHADPADPLTAAVIGQIPLELWVEARLRLAPATEVMAFEYEVSDILKSVSNEADLPSLEPARSWCAVWRRDNVVWRQTLSEPMHAVLSTFARGGTIAEAVGEAEDRWPGEPAELERALFDWFADWLGEGFFCALDLPGASELEDTTAASPPGGADTTQPSVGETHDDH
ncbi:MAG: hypothetical protein DRI90_21290 [Deltaproteobacteria bacterium]|nr:MAG: hypothetical protein DRI90_21290 [Deltaproteobacteria bacterium]